MLRPTKEAGRTVLDIPPIPIDDPETFRWLAGNSPKKSLIHPFKYLGKYLERLIPDKVEHLYAIFALYNPGLPYNMINEYIERKNNRQPWSLPHPLLEPIIGQTFGLWIYQQQVVRAAVDLGGLTVDQASALRRPTDDAREKAPTLRDQLVDGFGIRGIPNRIATDVFDTLLRIGPYALDREHVRRLVHLAYIASYMLARYENGPPPDPRREMLEWD